MLFCAPHHSDLLADLVMTGNMVLVIMQMVIALQFTHLLLLADYFLPLTVYDQSKIVLFFTQKELF